MKYLQRYLLFEIVRTFTLVVTGLTVVLVCVGAIRYAQEYGLAPEHMLRIMPYFVPSLLPFTIPATLLLTVTIVYGRVSGDLEMTAAKAAGINPFSLLVPAFLVGAVLSVVSFALTDRVGPWAVTQIQAVVIDAVEDIVLKQLKNERRFAPQVSGFDGVQLTVMDVRDRTLIRPAFDYVRRNGRRYHAEADEANLTFDLDNSQVTLRMVNCRGDYGEMILGHSGVFDFVIPMEGQFGKTNARDLPMTAIRQNLRLEAEKIERSTVERDLLASLALATGQFELLDEAESVDKSFGSRQPKNVRKMRTEFHSRPAMACSCFLFALLGAPFAVLRGKSQFFTTFLVCFLPIVGVYYPVTLGMLTQTKAGALDPTWAVWVADAMLATAGVVALAKTMRN